MREKEQWTECTMGAKTVWCHRPTDQLPLAFQVCSARLSGQESRPCWSRERAHQSTAQRECSAPARRATEDKRKTTDSDFNYRYKQPAVAAVASRAILNLPPASRCASVPLFASVSLSCWSPVPFRP